MFRLRHYGIFQKLSLKSYPEKQVYYAVQSPKQKKLLQILEIVRIAIPFTVPIRVTVYCDGGPSAREEKIPLP